MKNIAINSSGIHFFVIFILKIAVLSVKYDNGCHKQPLMD